MDMIPGCSHLILLRFKDELELLPLVHARGWSARVVLPGCGPYSDEVRASGFPVDFIPCGEYAQGRKGLGRRGSIRVQHPRDGARHRRTG
jgi:hypothetical protein